MFVEVQDTGLLGLQFDGRCHEFHFQRSLRALGGSLGNPFPSQRIPQKTDTGAVKRERLKGLTLLSSIKKSTIVD